MFSNMCAGRMYSRLTTIQLYEGSYREPGEERATNASLLERSRPTQVRAGADPGPVVRSRCRGEAKQDTLAGRGSVPGVSPLAARLRVLVSMASTRRQRARWKLRSRNTRGLTTS
jgi:hypothetical protein